MPAFTKWGLVYHAIDLCSAMYITYTCNFFLMSYIRTKDFFLDGFKVGELRPELQYYGLRPAHWDASADGEDEEDAV